METYVTELYEQEAWITAGGHALGFVSSPRKTVARYRLPELPRFTGDLIRRSGPH